MNNQNSAARLEARGPSLLQPPPSRKSLRPSAEAHAKGLVQLVASTAQTAGRTPSPCCKPAELFDDLQRPRTVSLASWLAAIIALAKDPRVTDAQLTELEIEFSAFVRSLRPYTALSVRTQWARETRAGCEADLAQAPAVLARELNDIVSLERAEAETRESIAESMMLLISFQVLKRQMAA